MSKMSEYVKIFKFEDKKHKLMSFCIKDEKLLEKYTAVWAKIEDLKNTKLIVLPVYDDRYAKTKVRAYCHKVYINFRGLNAPKDDTECESF